MIKMGISVLKMGDHNQSTGLTSEIEKRYAITKSTEDSSTTKKRVLISPRAKMKMTIPWRNLHIRHKKALD